MSEINKPQINLYHPEKLEDGVTFNFNTLIKFLILSVIVLVIWLGYQSTLFYMAKKERQNAFASQQVSYNKLVKYQQAFPNKQTSLKLSEIFEKTQFEYLEKKEVLDALNFSESTSFDGFYLYLAGLANADIKNLWLTSFYFSDAMENMQISGVARNASNVTSYLKSLQNTEFTGATFNDIAIVPFDNNIDAVKFLISTQKAEGAVETSQQAQTQQSVTRWSSLEENSKRTEQLSNQLLGGGQ